MKWAPTRVGNAESAMSFPHFLPTKDQKLRICLKVSSSMMLLMSWVPLLCSAPRLKAWTCAFSFSAAGLIFEAGSLRRKATTFVTAVGVYGGEGGGGAKEEYGKVLLFSLLFDVGLMGNWIKNLWDHHSRRVHHHLRKVQLSSRYWNRHKFSEIVWIELVS